jgi:hypothetical protein
MRQKLPELLDVGLAAGAAVMRVMQKNLKLVERYFETRAVRRIDFGAEVMEQGFDFAPVNVGTQRVLKDAAHQVGMLVAHDEAPGELGQSILCLWKTSVRQK